jgi:hypothetical protein
MAVDFIALHLRAPNAQTNRCHQPGKGSAPRRAHGVPLLKCSRWSVREQMHRVSADTRSSTRVRETQRRAEVAKPLTRRKIQSM